MTPADQHLPNDNNRIPMGLPKVQPAAGACFKDAIADQVGRAFPLGATVLGDGVNFSVFSMEASRVDLLLFDYAAATHPTRVIELDAGTHRITGWQRWIDTSRESPEDIMYAATAPPVPGMQYRVAPRSVTALFVRTDGRSGPVIELKPKPAQKA